MAADKVQLDSDGKRKLDANGKVVIADTGDACCCEDCADCPAERASTYTLTGHAYIGPAGAVPCDSDFTATLYENTEIPCLYSTGPFLVGASGVCGNYSFTLRRRTTAVHGYCGWELIPSPFASGSSILGNDPVGTYPDQTHPSTGADVVLTNLVIS